MGKPEKVWLALTDIGIMVYDHPIDASSAEAYGEYCGAYVPEESTLSPAIVAAVRAYQKAHVAGDERQKMLLGARMRMTAESAAGECGVGQDDGLSDRVVSAVKVYQACFARYMGDLPTSEAVRDSAIQTVGARNAMLDAIEADAKEREG